MLLELLDEKNPDYTANAATWAECRALYHGGDQFKAQLERFLPRNPEEPFEVYESRKNESAYTSYLGPIVDYFVSWLFSASPSIRAKEANTGKQIDADAYYAEFQEDVGGDVDLHDFMRERMTSALIEGRSHWLLVKPDDGQPPPDNKADWEARKLGTATMQPVDCLDVYDWECDEVGKLNWVNIHCAEKVRGSIRNKRNITRETWYIYDRENVETFVLEYEGTKRPGKKTDVPSKGVRSHGFAEVPLVTLHIKDGMWIGDRVRAPQVEHFRLTCANAWLIRRTCYAMPVLNLEDSDSAPTMGSGYYIALGLNEKFAWSGPPATPFDVISKEIAAKRDEIYRIVHQMAQGLDNNAETTGRSAESKDMDVAATRIMLNAYGAMVRKAMEETYEILSDSRGDTNVYWSVEGFNGFDTTSASSLIETAAEAQLLNIPSKTFRREVKVKAALAMLPEVDQHIKDAIRAEIFAASEEHGDLDEMGMSPELQMKVMLQEMKDKTQLALQDKKSKTAKEIQEIKSRDVMLEVAMAHGGKAGEGAHAATLASAGKPNGGSASTNSNNASGPSTKELNLIKADIG